MYVKSIEAMLDASGVENSEDFGDEKFSKFISTHTQFSTWEEMIEVATAEYIKLKLGF